MFESHDNTEPNDYHLQRCPVADRELAAAESHALIDHLVECRLLGVPDAQILPHDLNPRVWPRRGPVESAADYLARLQGFNDFSPRNWSRPDFDRVPISGDGCPVDTVELKRIPDSPFAAAVIEVRRAGNFDRSALAPRYCGEDWPDRRNGEPAGKYLQRAARQMLVATYCPPGAES